ncbi:hypothetical protein PPYR_10945 [Photinus pyralis]|uniref:RRM domain-containing protein n=1 Tax=Photinus pyralis TaxID=7054 RepID=A0A1Y1LN30_PHOPY|nr:uncharacterized RNA-binding protein C365.04c-like [Photinus pyralis]KAB0796884.1 hypothetical protein PPYR_10945 [Photinus pyralis]
MPKRKSKTESKERKKANSETVQSEESKCEEQVGEEVKQIDSLTSPLHNESTNENKKKSIAKTRYVVFVGNLSYAITEDDIRKHFAKAGNIVDVRLSKSSKGFAFVEFKDKTSYEKALSLNHTFLDGRRINVEYTDKASKKKKIVKKNLKLQAMRKAGKLQGSVKSNNKRSVRRAKARKAANKPET